MTRLTLVTIVLIISWSGLLAQSTAAASSSATIITLFGTEQSGEMNFGNFSSTSRAGSIKLSSDRTRAITGGVKLGDNNENVEVASFNILGSTYAYTTTLQSDPIVITRRGGKETVSVDLFTIKSSQRRGQNINSEILAIGATLHIGAFQATGYYLSETSFSVSVNFN